MLYRPIRSNTGHNIGYFYYHSPNAPAIGYRYERIQGPWSIIPEDWKSLVLPTSDEKWFNNLDYISKEGIVKEIVID